MALDFTLKKLRKKTITRIALYGLLLWGAFSTSAPLLIILLVLYKIYQWAQNYLAVKEFPRFLNEIKGLEVGNTKQIAGRLKISQQALIRRVKRMTKLGLLPEAAVQKDGDFVLLSPGSHPIKYWLMEGQEGAWPDRPQRQPETETETTTDSYPMKCTSCGAENMVSVGRTTRCPYCGTGLRRDG
mgnify:CR=1 FL=1